jgi:hypothetical protein
MWYNFTYKMSWSVTAACIGKVQSSRMKMRREIIYWTLFWAALTGLGVSILAAEASVTPILHASKTVVLGGEVAHPDQLSGVTRWRDLLIVCPDEGDAVNVFRPADSHYEVAGNVSLLSDNDKEIDMEAAASDAQFVYLIGSHSIRRTQVDAEGAYKKNRKRLTRIRPHSNSYSLFRLKLSDEGELIEKDSVDLRDILRDDEVLGSFFAMPGKEGGIDIEGVAVKDGKLFIGFRGPVLRGNFVPVVVLEFDQPHEYELRFVKLGGRGIRDLVAVEDGFLILAGPVGDGDGSYQLHLWNGEDCVPGAEELRGAVTPVAELAAGPGEKPEGVTVLAENAEQWQLLVVNDGNPAAAEWIAPKP